MMFPKIFPAKIKVDIHLPTLTFKRMQEAFFVLIRKIHFGSQKQASELSEVKATLAQQVLALHWSMLMKE